MVAGMCCWYPNASQMSLWSAHVFLLCRTPPVWCRFVFCYKQPQPTTFISLHPPSTAIPSTITPLVRAHILPILPCPICDHFSVAVRSVRLAIPPFGQRGRSRLVDGRLTDSVTAVVKSSAYCVYNTCYSCYTRSTLHHSVIDVNSADRSTCRVYVCVGGFCACGCAVVDQTV